MVLMVFRFVFLASSVKIVQEIFFYLLRFFNAKNLHISDFFRTFVEQMRGKGKGDTLKYNLQRTPTKIVKKCLILRIINKNNYSKTCIFQIKCLPLHSLNDNNEQYERSYDLSVERRTSQQVVYVYFKT